MIKQLYMGESRLPFVKKSTAERIRERWEEIKQLKLSEPKYIKIAPSQFPRKLRRRLGLVYNTELKESGESSENNQK
jgi:hypothetical protein